MNNLSSRLMKRFNHLLGEIDAVYHEMDWKLGLSDSAMAVLYTICDNGGCCLLQDICRLSGLSKQTVNSALRRLEADGIVYLKVFEGQKKKVYLTAKGQELAENTAVRLIEIENSIFASWTEDEKMLYLELTQRYLLSFQESIKKLNFIQKNPSEERNYPK